VTITAGVLHLAPGPSRREVDARYSVGIEAGATYLLSFRCRSDGLAGSQLVYAVAVDASKRVLSIFPNGGGYDCTHSDYPAGDYFAFEAPAGISSVILFFRARGVGEAEFRAIRLNQLSALSDS
jgi:hypothetical protein